MRTIIRILDSLRCDARFMRVPEIGFGSRVALVMTKYLFAALAAVHLPVPRSFRFAGRRLRCDTFFDPWFLVLAFGDERAALSELGLLGRASPTLVDIGAHNGETAVVWSQLLDNPTILSFEPNPDCYAILQRNTAGLRVQTFNVGLGDLNGQLPFDMGPAASFRRTFQFGEKNGNHTIPIEMRRGDELLNLPHIDLLKVDVEGYESQVLDGLACTLSRCEFLQIEISLERPKAHRFDEIARVFGRSSFDLVRVGHIWKERDRPVAMDIFLKNYNGVTHSGAGAPAQ